MSWLTDYISNADANSSALQWMLFMIYKFHTMFLQGTGATLFVALIGTFGGYLLGLLVGVAQNSAPGGRRGIVRFILSALLRLYVELFRGTPMIVQGMIIYYGLRQNGVEISSIAAGTIVMMLNTGAYMAETVRSGINAIPVGQREGALAVGLSPTQAMLFVILPQAVRNIIPEMCNTFLTNLKMTSVLNVIGVSELFYIAKTAGGTYYKYFEAYLAIAFIYLVLCFVFSRLTAILENRARSRKAYTLASEYIDADA
jgi:putative lysine transport system permease protein